MARSRLLGDFLRRRLGNVLGETAADELDGDVGRWRPFAKLLARLSDGSLAKIGGLLEQVQDSTIDRLEQTIQQVGAGAVDQLLNELIDKLGQPLPRTVATPAPVRVVVTPQSQSAADVAPQDEEKPTADETTAGGQ